MISFNKKIIPESYRVILVVSIIISALAGAVFGYLGAALSNGGHDSISSILKNLPYT